MFDRVLNTPLTTTDDLTGIQSFLEFFAPMIQVYNLEKNLQ